MDSSTQQPDQPVVSPTVATGHEGHCFVVMPTGRDPDEKRWFRGWYQVVIAPAVVDAGFEPILAADEEQPGAINDEIRTHLALDAMVVVDIGGTEPEDDPNPNVMYELGIRHALSLPMVMLAWKEQRLPFDVNNQRVIMEGRAFLDLETNRKKLTSFIGAALHGKYYRPMDAVKRQATIQAASASLGEESLLGALAQEIRDLKLSILAGLEGRDARQWQGLKSDRPTIKRFMSKLKYRRELYPHFIASGGPPRAWPALLRILVSPSDVGQMSDWTAHEWKTFIATLAQQYSQDPEFRSDALPGGLSEENIRRVRELLPAQPWPRGVHRDVAEELDLSANAVSKAIKVLIERGEVLPQVHGQVLALDDEGPV